MLAGCAAPIRDLTRTQYVNPKLSAAELYRGGLALLPITAGQGQEGYRRPLGDYLNANLARALPGAKVLTWQVAMDSLNRAGLTEEYQQLIQGYHETAIIDRARVKKMGDALGVQYALYCSLQDYSENNKTTYNFFSGIHTTTTSNVSAHCLLLDLQSGDVMQEILGQATSIAGDFEHSSAYEAYADTMAKGLLRQIPGSMLR